MMHGSIGVVVHPRRESRALIGTILEWANGHGKEVRGMEEARELLPDAVATVAPEDLVEGCGLIIALGGDGTILRGLKLAHIHSVPVLGVNLGRLAFLAEVSLEDLSGSLDAIDRGDYWLEERATMHIEHVDAPASEHLPTVVFNDSAMTRVAGSGPAALAVEVEGQVFGRYTADALVIATPTGSTAYSFAAGGPIVSPRHRGLLVTPVAPHAAFDRAVFLHPDEQLRVHVLERSAPVLLEVDGQRGTELRPGDTMQFSVDDRPAHVLRLHETGFYDRARRKLQLVDSAELAPDGAAETV
jgi:NAD+ kinase